MSTKTAPDIINETVHLLANDESCRLQIEKTGNKYKIDVIGNFDRKTGLKLIKMGYEEITEDPVTHKVLLRLIK